MTATTSWIQHELLLFGGFLWPYIGYCRLHRPCYVHCRLSISIPTATGTSSIKTRTGTTILSCGWIPPFLGHRGSSLAFGFNPCGNKSLDGIQMIMTTGTTRTATRLVSTILRFGKIISFIIHCFVWMAPFRSMMDLKTTLLETMPMAGVPLQLSCLFSQSFLNNMGIINKDDINKKIINNNHSDDSSRMI